jgi:predicted Zn-dependent peptidase
MFERSVLPNGLRVLTAPMSGARSASVGIFVGTGSRHEDDAIAGASHLLEHMLFKGTAKRPDPELVSGAIESVGGLMNASTDREVTIYYAKVGAAHFSLALDVLADMVAAPVMDPKELEREREVVIEEISMTYDQPDALADMFLDETLWPAQAMGRDIAGTKESVGAITLAQLRDYHARQYTPANMVVAVAGAVTHAQVVTEAERLLGALPAGPAPLPWLPADEGPAGDRVRVYRKRTDQAHIALATPGVATDGPGRPAADLLNTILGEGMTSRLFLELRERKGLAYDIHSAAMHYRDTGAMTVYCGTDPSKVDAALRAVLGQFEALASGVPEEEAARALSYAVGRLDLRLEDSRSVMGWVGGQELLRERVRTPDEIVAGLRAVSAADLADAARRLLADADKRLSIVGPFASEARFRKLLAS